MSYNFINYCSCSLISLYFWISCLQADLVRVIIQCSVYINYSTIIIITLAVLINIMLK